MFDKIINGDINFVQFIKNEKIQNLFTVKFWATTFCKKFDLPCRGFEIGWRDRIQWTSELTL